MVFNNGIVITFNSGTLTFSEQRINYLTFTFPITFRTVRAVIAQGGYIPYVAAISYNVNTVTTTRVTVQGTAVDFTNVSGTANTVWCIAIGRS